jgi:hypothetical protein
VHHDLGAELAERGVDELRVGDRALDHRQALVRREAVAPRGRVVVDHDDLVAVGEQPVGQVGADEAGAAGDQDLGHALLTFLGIGWAPGPPPALAVPARSARRAC